MTDTPTKPGKKPARMQHVVAHETNKLGTDGKVLENVYDEVLVFGQKIDALEYCHGKADWAYAAVAHGESFVDALKAARS